MSWFVSLGIIVIWNIRPRAALNSNLAKSWPKISLTVMQSFQNSARSTAAILSCCVQKCQYDSTTEQTLGVNECLQNVMVKGNVFGIKYRSCMQTLLPEHC